MHPPFAQTALCLPDAEPASLSLTFSGGTVLVRGDPDIIRRLRLPGVSWDRRVAAFRAPAYRLASIRQALRRRSVAVDDLVTPSRLASPRIDPSPLRAYQQRALNAWLMAGCRGVVAQPTGSGKTHVALAAIAHRRCAAVVLVPTRVLLNQWVTRLRACCHSTVGVVGDGEYALGPVTVCTFESAFRRMDTFGHRFGLLVVDEVHHLGNGSRSECLEMCAAPARLGLTATPPESGHQRQRLAALVGRVVHTTSIAQLSGDHLAPYSNVRLFVDLTAEEAEEYHRHRGLFSESFREFRRTGQRSWSAYVKVAAASASGRAALFSYHRSRQIVSTARAKAEVVSDLLADHHHDRALVFTADNAAAYALSRQLLVPAVTCDIRRTERESLLRRFRDGRLRALVSARVLNEGIDLPDARVGVITGGSHGNREHVQRVGRLLRPQNGKKAVVYEVVARDTYELDHAEKRRRYLVR